MQVSCIATEHQRAHGRHYLVVRLLAVDMWTYFRVNTKVKDGYHRNTPHLCGFYVSRREERVGGEQGMVPQTSK